MTTDELLVDLKNKYTSEYKDNPILSNKIEEIKKENPNVNIEYILSAKERYVKDFLLDPILEVIDVGDISDKYSITAVSLPIDQINASAIRVNDTQYLIIINERLMALIQSWGELQYLLSQNLNKIENQNIAKIFAPIIDCYLTPNSNKTLPVYSFDDIPIEVSSLLSTKTIMQERFIMAHELAHIVLNHLKPLDKKNFNIDELLKEGYYQNEQAYKEYEADVQAVKWLSKLCKDEDLLILHIEVLVIFHTIECNLGFPSINATHPSALARIVNIAENCRELFKNSKYSIDEMINNCRDVESFKI